MQSFRIPSKLARLKTVVAYARVMKSLRETAKPEDAKPKKREAGKT